VGAYPPGQHPDLLRGEPGKRGFRYRNPIRSPALRMPQICGTRNPGHLGQVVRPRPRKSSRIRST
jgi:uncharacterized protein YjlB